MHTALFFIFATIAVGCGVLVVTRRQPVSSALALVGVMVSLAALYLMLGGPFIAAVQIIVYAGAIVVLFIFVIMLLNAGRERRTEGSLMVPLLGIPLLLSLVGALSFVVWRAFPETQIVRLGGNVVGTPVQVGRSLFTTYLLPFEVTSVLILIAIVGAVVLAYKELD